MPLDYFISDLDGTLDDRMPGYTATFIDVGIANGIHPREAAALEKEYIGSAGTPLGQQFANVFAKRGIEADIKRCEAQFWSRMGNERARPFSGTVALLETLSQQGRMIFITTGSRTENARSRLDEMGILKYVARVAGDGEGMKKGPAHIEAFAQATGDPQFKEKAAYLGDGPADMKLAAETGIAWPIGITYTTTSEALMAAGARRVVDDLPNVPPLLAELDQLEPRRF